MSHVIAGIDEEFRRYKRLAEKAIEQVGDSDLSREGPGGGNSVATLVWHIAGNLRSRFTDFRTTDGEKPWRRRDEEFVQRHVERDEVLAKWESGWVALVGALGALTDADLEATVQVRGESLRIDQALQRSVTHTAYHVGQIVYLAKALRGESWRSLTIPVGESDAFNRAMGFETTPQRVAVVAVPATSPEAEALMADLDMELHGRYPGLPTHGLRERDLVDPLTVFLVGRLDGEVVACGATRRLEPTVAEIKRMYVRPLARGRGFGRQMLAALEASARDSGVARLLLETGDRQPEAVGLYQSAGFTPIAPYGEFKGNPVSRCFEKRLTAP